MTSVEIKEIKREDYALWDELVERSPQGTIFHKSWWLKVAGNVTNTKIKIFLIHQSDELIGGCALSTKKVGLLKLAFSPPIDTPTPYGGAMLKPIDAKNIRKIESIYKTVVNNLNEIYKDNFDYILLANHPDFRDIRHFVWSDWDTKVNYTYTLPLGEIAEIWNRIGVRTDIRKAEKEGILIVNGESIKDFCNLLQLTYKRQGRNVPVKMDFFDEIYKELKNREACKVYYAINNNGETIASAISLFDGKRGYYWVAASDPELRGSGEAALILWNILKDVSENYDEIDLIGASTPNIVKFKSAFNPELVPYYSVKWANRRGIMSEKIYNWMKRKRRGKEK